MCCCFERKNAWTDLCTYIGNKEKQAYKYLTLCCNQKSIYIQCLYSFERKSTSLEPNSYPDTFKISSRGIKQLQRYKNEIKNHLIMTRRADSVVKIDLVPSFTLYKMEVQLMNRLWRIHPSPSSSERVNHLSESWISARFPEQFSKQQ